MKKILIAVCLCLAALPATAHNTKPNDVVGVNYIKFKPDSAMVAVEKTYTKPWAQIKVDADTIKRLDAFISRLKGQFPAAKTFRIAHLVIVDDVVARVMLLTDQGTAIAIDMQQASYCTAGVEGNSLINDISSCGEF